MTLQDVIIWKYGAGVAGTKGNDITSWNHPTIPQPDSVQIALDKAEYDQYLKDEKKDRKDRKKAIRQKLGMSVSDIKALAELVADENED